MGLVLDRFDGRLNRRAVLRAGIAGLGFHRVLSSSSPAFGQYDDAVVCPFGEIGFTTDPLVYYYYGLNCPDMDQFYEIDSGAELQCTGLCPSPPTCNGTDDDCVNCRRLIYRPPIPGKSLPPIPGKSLPPIPGKSLPPIPGKQGLPSALPAHKKGKIFHDDPNNPTTFQCFHMKTGVDLSEAGLTTLQHGPFTLQQKHPKAHEAAPAKLFRANINGQDRAVCLLIYQADAAPQGAKVQPPLFGIGQEVDNPPDGLDPLPVKKLGGKYHVAYVKVGAVAQQCFHILTKN